MSDFRKHLEEQKRLHPETFTDYDEKFREFKIGAMLKEARQEAHLTQQELADRIHTKKTAISRIENHAADIKLSTLWRIADALGINLQKLFAHA